MQTRTLARWGLLAILLAAAGACRSARVERRQPDGSPTKQTAGQTDDAPPEATTGSADREPDAPAPPATGEDAAAPSVSHDGAAAPLEPADGGPTLEAVPFVDPGQHCGEPPERTAARENMRRMAEAHARLGEALAALRADLQAQALRLALDLALEDIPRIAADLARRCAEVPDAAPVGAELLEPLLREAAFWGAVCRTLEGGWTDCDRLDVDGNGDGACCLSVAHLVRLARARPQSLSLPSAVGRAFGWTWSRQNDERIWLVALHGQDEASCVELDGRDPAERWSGPVCRALAARDVSRCEALAEPSRRRTCAALVHAILGPGTATAGQPSAAGTLLREHVAPTGSHVRCADALPAIVAELLDAADVFELGALELPGIEVERGMIPPP
ncbi:MAG: hypothetical protein JXB32_14340 [Deltaproteobacteria bacterium]|nr:hypothetical protein [Deltaproteobacteria bacterium]